MRWGLSYTYDGFGNKTGQTVTQGTGPHLSISVDAGSNRVTPASGAYYDAAGNQVNGPGLYLGAQYDAEGRMVSVNHERYAYSAAGQRLLRQRLDANWQVTDEAVWLYSPQGERVAELRLAMDSGRTAMTLWAQRRWAYLAGKRVGLAEDRLGSGRARRLAPYGEELGGATVNDADKFATYHRDQGTGLDYAQQRYYTSAWGRFTSPDPYGGSAQLEMPQSLNRYAYVENDPVNRNDPSGLSTIIIGNGLFRTCVPHGEGGETCFDWSLERGPFPDGRSLSREESEGILRAMAQYAHEQREECRKQAFRARNESRQRLAGSLGGGVSLDTLEQGVDGARAAIYGGMATVFLFEALPFTRVLGVYRAGGSAAVEAFLDRVLPTVGHSVKAGVVGTVAALVGTSAAAIESWERSTRRTDGTTVFRSLVGIENTLENSLFDCELVFSGRLQMAYRHSGITN